MKKERLISLMLAGIIATSVGVMAGCDGDQGSVKHDYINANKYENKYIVLEDKDGKEILHKGTYYRSVQDSNNGFDLVCSDYFITNREYSAYDHKPSETEYDEECELCK